MKSYKCKLLLSSSFLEVQIWTPHTRRTYFRNFYLSLHYFVTFPPISNFRFLHFFSIAIRFFDETLAALPTLFLPCLNSPLTLLLEDHQSYVIFSNTTTSRIQFCTVLIHRPATRNARERLCSNISALHFNALSTSFYVHYFQMASSTPAYFFGIEMHFPCFFIVLSPI